MQIESKHTLPAIPPPIAHFSLSVSDDEPEAALVLPDGVVVDGLFVDDVLLDVLLEVLVV